MEEGRGAGRTRKGNDAVLFLVTTYILAGYIATLHEAVRIFCVVRDRNTSTEFVFFLFVGGRGREMKQDFFLYCDLNGCGDEEYEIRNIKAMRIPEAPSAILLIDIFNISLQDEWKRHITNNNKIRNFVV